MIQFKSIISKYNWDIEVYILINKSDIQNIKNKLYKLPYYNSMLYRISRFKNSGFSYSIPNKSILVIGLQDSMLDFIDTFNHEKNHIETYIGNYYNIQYDSEEFSIMSGYTAKILFSDLINTLVTIKYLY